MLTAVTLEEQRLEEHVSFFGLGSSAPLIRPHLYCLWQILTANAGNSFCIRLPTDADLKNNACAEGTGHLFNYDGDQAEVLASWWYDRQYWWLKWGNVYTSVTNWERTRRVRNSMIRPAKPQSNITYMSLSSKRKWASKETTLEWKVVKNEWNGEQKGEEDN